MTLHALLHDPLHLPFPSPRHPPPLPSPLPYLTSHLSDAGDEFIIVPTSTACRFVQQLHDGGHEEDEEPADLFDEVRGGGGVRGETRGKEGRRKARGGEGKVERVM